MELNINCDLGEKSEIFEAKNDYELLKIINTANIACGYHAGSKAIIKETVINSKKFDVSIGAHPGFKDRKNFGRKRYYLTPKELNKLITEQLEIIVKISGNSFLHISQILGFCNVLNVFLNSNEWGENFVTNVLNII